MRHGIEPEALANGDVRFRVWKNGEHQGDWVLDLATARRFEKELEAAMLTADLICRSREALLDVLRGKEEG